MATRKKVQLVTPRELPAICRAVWERERQRRPGITQAALALELAGDDPKKESYRTAAGRTYVSRAINGTKRLEAQGHDGLESFRLEMIEHLTGEATRGPFYEVTTL